MAPVFANLGCVHQAAGQLDEARHWLQRARKAYEGVDDPISTAHLEYCTSLVAQDDGDLPTALRHVERAMEIVEGLKNLDWAQGARHRPISLWQDYAERQAAQLILLNETEQDPNLLDRAFRTADYSRARSLFELVWESQLPEGRGREVEGRLQDQLREMAAQRRWLVAAGRSEEATRIGKEAAMVALELEEQRALRRDGAPELATLPQPAPVPVSAVRDLLGPGDVLLRYFLGTPSSFLFVVDQGGSRVHRLAPRATLEAHATALHHAWKDSFLDPEPAEQLAGRALELLLPEDAIPKGTKSLWIVPDGALHYLSFAALGRPDAEPLGNEYTLRYLPSAGVGVALQARARERPPAPRTLAMFADPIFSDRDNRMETGAEVGSSPSPTREVVERLPTGPLPRLRYTAHEAEAILDLLPASERLSFLEFAALKSAALDPQLRRYRILHFATHAFVDETLPELSGLVLSRFTEEGAEVDGNLYLHEIFAARFQADLVVLSGCQTALGRKLRGDGLLGMTRGFFHAGASQLLVSLWSVDDEATATMMAEFYQAHLVEGQGIAEALQTAQRRLREHPHWRAPFYWAPFVLQGVEPTR
jgi:CHAT domain-containing protein